MSSRVCASYGVKKLIPFTRLTILEREKERLAGERGQLVASIAQSGGKIAEIELQIMQIEQDMRTEVGRELADIRARTSELVEKKVAAQDQLQRIDIRAPQDGVVHQLAVHTVGGVIASGEQIMLIVPEADTLTIEVRVQPQDVDQLSVGQSAVVRLSAFNQQTTPELNGRRRPCVSRCQRGHKDRDTFLYSPGSGPGERACSTCLAQVDSRHAGGGLHSDQSSHGHFLPHSASMGSDRTRIPRDVGSQDELFPLRGM